MSRLFATSIYLFIASLIIGCGAEDKRNIPLKSIYSTNGQDGLQILKSRLEEPYGQDLQEMSRSLQGASNVFLVRGKDIAAAVRATRLIFMSGRSADVPVQPEDGLMNDHVWLVAYFGIAGSGPPAWTIKSVDVKDKCIQVRYTKPQLEEGTTDIHQYFVWIPLQKLTEGTYTLELIDEGKEEVMLQRRVILEPRDDKNTPK